MSLVAINETEVLKKKHGFIRQFHINGYLLDEPILLQQKHATEIRNYYCFYIYQPKGNKEGQPLYDRFTCYAYLPKLVNKMSEATEMSLIGVEGHFTLAKKGNGKENRLIAEDIVFYSKTNQPLRTLAEVEKAYQNLKVMLKQQKEEENQ